MPSSTLPAISRRASRCRASARGGCRARCCCSASASERLMTEAVESHIGGWFWNAAARSRVRPVAQPEYDFELPGSENEDWEFTATVAVQAKPELPTGRSSRSASRRWRSPRSSSRRARRAARDGCRARSGRGSPRRCRRHRRSSTSWARRRDTARLRHRARPRRRRRGDRAGPRRDERRRDEGDEVRARRRVGAGLTRDGEGDQGEGTPAARRRARARRERVRDASPSCAPTSRRA